jgi:hypothetical protein
MDPKVQEIYDFINGKAGRVNSYLITVNKGGMAYPRQVSTFIEGWRIGTISAASNLKVTHARNNPKVTYMWAQQQEKFGSKNVWAQGLVEVVDDPAGVQDFLERRSKATGAPIAQTEFQRVVLYTTPTLLRAEGLAGERSTFLREFPAIG